MRRHIDWLALVFWVGALSACLYWVIWWMRKL